MYLPVDIYEKIYFGLLDSGATRSVIGSKGWDVLSCLDVKLYNTNYGAVRVADGRKCPIKGTLDVIITLEGVSKLISFLIVPELPHELILGIDFWKAFGLVPDVSSMTCTIHDGTQEIGCNMLLEATVNAFDFLLEELVLSQEMLSSSQQESLSKLIDKFRPTLGRPQLGCTQLIEHKIETGDAKPIRSRCISYSPKLLAVMHDGLDNWLKQDVVEKSCSPWASPVLLLPKPDQSYRWVVDLRNVNKVTKGDSYPLPRVNEILDQLRDAKFLSSIDLTSAYFQIPLEESSKEKTAFIVPGRGLFQFKRMPQGLHTSAATWQRFIDTVVGEDLKPYVFVYLDDIIIVSQTFEAHLELLEKVLTRLDKAGLTVNMEKCHFCREELRYLGYVVNKHGLQVNPDKVEAINQFKRPTNLTELQRFIGMASWYRRFVPNFSSLMAPLHSLTAKKAKFVWDECCESAYVLIKEKLTSAPVLTCPDFTKTFDLYCDASGVGLGAVLSQEGKVVAYASRSLTKSEKKYFPTELECLAVLWAIEKFRGYLEGYHFNVITDHASLVWLNNLKDPCGRLGRWAVRLQQYNYNVIHRKGSEHQAPDALSRNPLIYDGESVDLITVENPVTDPWYSKMLDSVKQDPEKFPQWHCEDYQLYKLTRINREESTWNRVIPKEHRSKVLSECHDHPLAGHLGASKTFNKIRQLYYWPKLLADVKRYVKNCHTCLQCKVPPFKPAGMMGERLKISCPMQVVATDLIGKLPRSSEGYTHLAVSVCLFSKYVWLRPLRSASMQNTVKHLEQDIFLVAGVPGLLLCDNGSEFKNKEVKNLCEKYGVQIRHNFAYHPQSNPAERVNRVIKTMITAYIMDKANHRSWARDIHYVANAINTSVHEVTGFTPHRLLYGSEWCPNGQLSRVSCNQTLPPFADRLEDPAERDCRERIRLDVVNRLKLSHEKAANYYNLRRREVDFEVGQTVYRRNFVKSDASKYFAKKLAPKFIGPFRVVRKVGLRAYLLLDEQGEEDGPWHVNDLKPGPSCDGDSDSSSIGVKE